MTRTSPRGTAISSTPLSCCIVGAGPAGVTLAWLLARQGIPVTLLERHADFDRDFRGDTLHPGALEIIDQMGLMRQLSQLPHSKMSTLSFHTPTGSLVVADLRRLTTRFPFVMLVAQSRFLELVVDDAQRFECFQLLRNADAGELVEEDESVVGVRYRDSTGASHEIRAGLTVATDGRNSRLRKLAKLEAISTTSEIDVLWFRVPRQDHEIGGAFLGSGGYMIVLQRADQWQVGFVIPKGTFRELRSAGIRSLRRRAQRLAPGLTEALEALQDWQQIHFLSVQADRLRRWHCPGLLLLGDAAHVMSPVGGVGINYAIQDAVEAANVLSAPLKQGTLSQRDLRAVQRRRQGPTKLVQRMQSFDQRHIIERALKSTGEFRLPWWFHMMFRLPFVRSLPTRIFAFGSRRVAVGPALHS